MLIHQLLEIIIRQLATKAIILRMIITEIIIGHQSISVQRHPSIRQKIAVAESAAIVLPLIVQPLSVLT